MLRFVLTLAILLMSREAFAFCRMTTCDETKEKCEPDEKGCPTKGDPVAWDRNLLPVRYAFTERGSTKVDDEKVRAAVNSAVDRWQSVICAGGGQTTLRFRQLEDIPAEEGLGLASNDNAVGREDGTPKFGLYFRDRTWTANPSALAVTGLSYAEGGRVVGAKMEINTAMKKFRFDAAQEADDFDFQAIVTHEMGHWIGIAHSKELDSIMAPDYCEFEERCEVSVGRKRVLSRDDTAAVCALYPPARATLPPMGDPRAETAGCSQSPAAAGSGAGAVLVLLALAAVGRKKTRE